MWLIWLSSKYHNDLIRYTILCLSSNFLNTPVLRAFQLFQLLSRAEPCRHPSVAFLLDKSSRVRSLSPWTSTLQGYLINCSYFNIKSWCGRFRNMALHTHNTPLIVLWGGRDLVHFTFIIWLSSKFNLYALWTKSYFIAPASKDSHFQRECNVLLPSSSTKYVHIVYLVLSDSIIGLRTCRNMGQWSWKMKFL